jgi:hypothetical protein
VIELRGPLLVPRTRALTLPPIDRHYASGGMRILNPLAIRRAIVDRNMAEHMSSYATGLRRTPHLHHPLYDRREDISARYGWADWVRHPTSTAGYGSSTQRHTLSAHRPLGPSTRWEQMN